MWAVAALMRAPCSARAEGNATMLNVHNKPFAIGHIPRLMRWLWPTRVVQYDAATGGIRRGPDGFCIECKPGETGELISRINHAYARFDGYVVRAACDGPTHVGPHVSRAAAQNDQRSSQSKLLHDVFVKGDRYFRTYGGATRRVPARRTRRC